MAHAVYRHAWNSELSNTLDCREILAGAVGSPTPGPDQAGKPGRILGKFRPNGIDRSQVQQLKIVTCAVASLSYSLSQRNPASTRRLRRGENVRCFQVAVYDLHGMQVSLAKHARQSQKTNKATVSTSDTNKATEGTSDTRKAGNQPWKLSVSLTSSG